MFKADALKKLETVPHDMPLFLLLGSDPAAGDTIRFWVVDSDKQGVGEPKLQAAEEVAVRCDEYQPKKLPD